jgi:hypothetical protein
MENQSFEESPIMRYRTLEMDNLSFERSPIIKYREKKWKIKTLRKSDYQISDFTNGNRNIKKDI